MDLIDYTLVILLGLPAAGAIIGSLLPSGRLAKYWALLVSLATLGVAIAMAVSFDYAAAGQLQYKFPDPAEGLLTIPFIHFGVKLGVDSISLWLVVLTALLSPLAIAASFESIQQRAKEYYAWMLVLLAAMLGVFVARDLLLFYVFFELTLIPMFFIIGIWGGAERTRAAGKFFLFTFTGSVFTLATAIYLGVKFGTFDIQTITRQVQAGGLTHTEQWWVVLGFLAGFAVKVPLFPVHTWLPLAHTEAPTAGSVILAGILLKLGTYGLIRLAVPIGMLTNAAYGVNGVAFPLLIKAIAVVCIIGIIYGALVAWVQQDIKKLVAYSSVSHLGFCVLGLIALNTIGMQGSVLYMINHGLSTGAMFLVVGMIYDRFHTRDINELSGLARVMPKLAFFFVFFALSSIGLPGLNGFVSEFLTVLGAFTSEHLGVAYGIAAAVGVILGAVYMLHMVARVIWGPLKAPHLAEHGQESHGQAATPGHEGHGARHPEDIGFREVAVLVPIALAVLYLGVLPTPLLSSLWKPIEQIRQPLVQVEPQGQAPTAAADLAVRVP